jgi:superfamily I DNA/RNA helicase
LNEIGNWLKNWFIETNNYEFIIVGDNQNRAIKYIVDKIQNEVRKSSFHLNDFKSVESFLDSLELKWKGIYKLQHLVEKFDRERILDEERFNANLIQEEINEIIRQINNQLIEKNVEDSGKTILSTIHKAKGLEFDYVFLISVDEEILPNKNERAWEEVNLFYTAITRTKKELYLTTSCWEDCSRYIISCLDRKLLR